MKVIQLGKLAEAIGANLDQVARAIKITTFNDVIRNTRVDEGRLRGNWQTSVGEPILSQTDRADQIPQGQPGGIAEDEVSETVKGDTVDYLTNNLPYAAVWEERDGMVDKAIAKVERNVKKAIESVS